MCYIFGMLYRQSTVAVFVRHRQTCPHREDESYPRCQCPKALRWSQSGKQYRKAAGTRSWSVADEKARELERQLQTGQHAQIAPAAPAHSIAQAVETFITAKRDEGSGP